MDAFERFMVELVRYLKVYDRELMEYLDYCFITELCDKSAIVEAFNHAYMHWLFFSNIKRAAEIIRERLMP